MRQPVVVVIAIVMIVVIGSCQRASPPPSLPEASSGAAGNQPSGSLPPAVTAYAYDCSDGSYVVAEFGQGSNEMWLFLPDQTVELPHAASGSGARYASDEISFWSKGDEAILEREGSEVSCQVNRHRSKIESIKLSGGDFFAMGNEPGWTLEMYPGWMVFTTSYGEERHQAAIEETTDFPDQFRTDFRGGVGGDQLTVSLIGGADCFDTMSGARFETSVRVELGDRTHLGCGQALH